MADLIARYAKALLSLVGAYATAGLALTDTVAGWIPLVTAFLTAVVVLVTPNRSPSA